MSILIVVPKQVKQETKQVYDKDVILVEDERRYSWQSDCDNCTKKLWWNHQVRHRRTKRCVPMDSEYHPGDVPRRHQCMQNGTNDGKWKERYNNFYRYNVVRDKENLVSREEKIKLWKKLTGYGYVDSLKTLDNMMKAKSWERYSFEY